MPEKQDLIPIIYIAGAGRSGSTVVGEALGMLPGALHLGEVRALFDYTVDPSGLYICSCGKSYRECSFWDPLLRRLFGDDWSTTISSLGLRDKIPSSKGLLWRHFFTASDMLLIEHAAKTIPVMEAALAQTGSHIVIDSSKAMPYAWLLARSGKVRLLTVHLIRDPRGVLFSWMHRPIALHDSKIGYSTLRSLKVFDAYMEWIRANMSAYLLKLFGLPYIRLRYEDFVVNPQKAIYAIVQSAKDIGIEFQEVESTIDLLMGHQVLLGEHLIAGNPRLKNRKGLVNVEADDKWKDEMSVWEKIAVNTILGPWLIFYGYF